MKSSSAAHGSPVTDQLEKIHETFKTLNEGAVATYIPELAHANPDWFGIALVTASGHVYEAGDSGQAFTIQSISKPFVYGIALEDSTRTDVMARVGIEPTGDVFNAISLEPGTGRPRNPMINAGAIATTGLVGGKLLQTRSKRILDSLSAFAGRPLALDEAVYRSESETGHRNRAIGHMLRNFDILKEPPDPVVDLYFQQCSVSVNCRDLATMAATLANRGVNPVTGRQALRGEYVESVLGVMGSCGMYDYAGEWMYRVGMPAKSGVSGGIIAVLPGHLGIAVYSPRLDPHGNSVRGIRVCEELSRVMNLHLLTASHGQASVIRLRYDATQVSSNRMRSPADAAVLREHGAVIKAFQLQGQLTFSSAEAVVNEALAQLASTRCLILDLKHVPDANESASRLFFRLLRRVAQAGRQLVFTHVAHCTALRRYLRIKLGAEFETSFAAFDDSDLALEWCEDIVLRQHGVPAWDPAQATDHYDIFDGLDEAEVTHLRGLLQRRRYAAGDVVVTVGGPADELFLLHTGRASVTITPSDHVAKRLAAFSPGMAFGEMAMLDRSPRSTSVIADTDLVCDVLSVAEFDRLDEAAPHIKIVILRNLADGLSRKLRQAVRENSVLGR